MVVSLAPSHPDQRVHQSAGGEALPRGACATQWFQLDQLQIELTASNGTVLEAIRALWSDSFFVIPTEAVIKRDVTTIQIDFQAVALRPPIPQADPIYRAVDLAIWKSATGFLLMSGTSWLALHLANGRACGVLDPTFWGGRPQDQRDFFLLPFLIFGHQQGYYGLHANALSDGQRDYLIIGPSGSGKSTLAVQLLAQGWRCGGDDLILLRAADPSAAAEIEREFVRALALRRDFALSAKTLAYCSPQVIAPTVALCPSDAKRIVPASTLVRAALQSEFWPTCLLFAAIVDRAESTLAPLDQSSALVALAQQSAGIMTDRAIGQVQLDLLAQLCRQASSYQLLLGRDLFAQPPRVAALLQGAY